MNSLVLYHSLHGNTKTVAECLARGLEEVGIRTDCKSIDVFDANDILVYDFIAIGSPTHILKISKAMKAFLDQLTSFNLKEKIGFAFDTRNESRMNKRGLSILENSAARVIESKMKGMKIKIIRPRQSALVIGREGPLDSGVEESFLEIGRQIGKQIAV